MDPMSPMTGMEAGGPLLTLAYMLVSPWKPIVLLIPLMGWAWLVSSVFDKHAARFFLGRELWNTAHLVAGLIAVSLAFLMPLPGILGFVVGLAAMLLVLGLDIGVFVLVTNKDERVPEQHHLRLDFSSMAEARAAKSESKKAASVTLRIMGPSKMELEAPQKDSPEFATRAAAEQIFIKAVQTRASQVDLAPASETAYVASYLVDGVRQPGDPIPAPEAVQIINFWKSAAELDLKDVRRKLTGRVSAGNDAGTTEIKINTSGSKRGLMLSMLLNPADAVKRDVGKLGLTDTQRKVVDALIETPGGIVLLAATADNGRTTTLYSMVRLHDAYTQNVQTVEMEIEDPIEGVRQQVFTPTEDGPDHATMIRSILRRDPDVVGIAELPDAETAQVVINGELERSRVYVSVKIDSALGAAQLWAKAVGDPKDASKHLGGVIAQKLCRRLCENCRVGYAPTPEALKKLGLPTDKVSQLFKKGGQVMIRNKPEVCPVCQGVGYVGQVGLFEVYQLDDEMRTAAASKDWNGLRAAFRKSKSPSMHQSALMKVAEGVTSVEEVMRVTAQPAQKKPAARTPTPTDAA